LGLHLEACTVAFLGNIWGWIFKFIPFKFSLDLLLQLDKQVQLEKQVQRKLEGNKLEDPPPDVPKESNCASFKVQTQVTIVGPATNRFPVILHLNLNLNFQIFVMESIILLPLGTKYHIRVASVCCMN
jgi:hypothetical protein